ncbi:MAG: DUF2497 domain-containing protein [Litorimonas sp.]
MSEQTPEPTPNSAADADFSSADAEPSMEDILASIRKIISDDSEPSAETPAETSVTVEAVTTTRVEAEVTQPVSERTSNAEMPSTGLTSADDMLDIEALLTDFDVVEPIGEAPSFAPVETPAFEIAPAAAPVSDSFDDDLSIPVPDPEEDVAGDDMDLLMDELMDGLSGDISASPAPANGPVVATVAPAVAADDPDMDLVKSMMEDLTDADEADPAPETAPVSETSEPEAVDELDAMEDDIFDALMDMSLEDDADEPDLSINDGIPSLTAIAEAAEAAMQSAPSETSSDEPSLDAALLGGATLAASDDPVVSASEPSDTDNTPATATVASETPAADPSKETPMPSAVRSETILDDVTEEATMSAFAQLNQVVEDKAVLSERGPRVGDLVQEALKPMLKEWLDEHIQGIVERAVAKEVKRISAGK